MVRFYGVISAMSIGMFVALVLLMNTLGGTQPIHPALRGFIEGCEDIPQPCWYGIVPGVTTLEDAKRSIISRNWVYSHTETQGVMFPYEYYLGDSCNIALQYT